MTVTENKKLIWETQGWLTNVSIQTPQGSLGYVPTPMNWNDCFDSDTMDFKELLFSYKYKLRVFHSSTINPELIPAWQSQFGTQCSI